jgi:predicted dienelactone hydrolase
MMIKRILPFLLLAAACSSAPNQSATAVPSMKVGEYSADMGPSPVGAIPSAMLHDATRNKDVEVSIAYPTRGGGFPIVVFSHGYGSSLRAYEPLVSYWTSNGYVVIRPNHADNGQLQDLARDVTAASPPPQQQQRGQRSPQQGVVVPLVRDNPAEKIFERERETQWNNRVADVELVINSLDTIEHDYSELVGKMDHSKIAVAGHGYGAFTALMAGGMKTFGNPPLQINDSRIRAVVAFSPPGIAANRGTTAQSWSDIHIPVLFMTGTNDRGANESENAAWRRESFDNSAPGDKYFVLISGARYSTFTGQVSIFPIEQAPQQAPAAGPYSRPTPVQPGQPGGNVIGNERQNFALVKTISLAFLDGYLKNDTAARDLLQPATLEKDAPPVKAATK